MFWGWLFDAGGLSPLRGERWRAVHSGSPYRLSPDAKIEGIIPINSIIKVINIDGNWAKIEYHGAEYYVWRSKLEKISNSYIDSSEYATMVDGSHFVSIPIKLSTWGKQTLAYKAIYDKNIGTDWTQPITRKYLAQMIVSVMQNRYGSWSTWQTLPIVVPEKESNFSDIEPTFEIQRVILWGIMKGNNGKFNPNGYTTREEMASYLYNLIQYDFIKLQEIKGGASFKSVNLNRYSDANKISSNLQKSLSAIIGEGLFDGIITSKNINPKSYCTIEQAQELINRISVWLAEKEYEKVASRSTRKQGYVYMSENYTIQSDLGKKPYLYINNEGDAELNLSSPTTFTVKYLSTRLDENGRCYNIYTIQANDGKYLGITAANAHCGERVRLVNKKYYWKLSTETVSTHIISNVENHQQVVNASGNKSGDGTPIIMWFENNYGNAKNAHFRFNLLSK